jgi:large subunit ribosomal protein L13
MQTSFARKEDYKDSRRWCHVDASGKVLGRLATRIAMALMGKDRPDYTPNVDTGAFVVVTNAGKIVLTGRKGQTKTYARYTGYPGGYRETGVQEVLKKHPDRVIREAVRRMLPKSKLGDAMLKKLKVYAGTDHPHTYHKPEPLES